MSEEEPKFRIGQKVRHFMKNWYGEVQDVIAEPGERIFYRVDLMLGITVFLPEEELEAWDGS
jgi:hypothetical protein